MPELDRAALDSAVRAGGAIAHDLVAPALDALDAVDRELEALRGERERLGEERDLSKRLAGAAIAAIQRWCDEDCIDESECDECSLNIQAALDEADTGLRRLVSALAALSPEEEPPEEIGCHNCRHDEDECTGCEAPTLSKWEPALSQTERESVTGYCHEACYEDHRVIAGQECADPCNFARPTCTPGCINWSDSPLADEEGESDA